MSSSSTDNDAKGAHATPIRVLQYNVAAAVRDEEFAETKWSARSPRIEALIRLANADIVCLQELRNFPGSDTVETFLARFSDVYQFELAYRNPTKLAFAQAILYRKDRFYMEHKVKPIYSGGTLLLEVVLSNVKEEERRRTLCVGNVHFPMDEDNKLHAAIDMVQHYASRESPLVLCGDFNFFPDMAGCTLQRATLVVTGGFADLGKGAVTSQENKPLEGTFVGFEHDKMKPVMGYDLVSRLDHVFGRGVTTKTPARLLTETMDSGGEPKELSVRGMPSDHLPLLVEVYTE